MGFLSICVRLCLLHFVVSTDKGLGNATEPLSSPSSSLPSSSSSSFSSSSSPSSSSSCPRHSFVIQKTTTAKGCSNCVLVPEETLQNLLEIKNATIKDLQPQEEESEDLNAGEEVPHLPSMEEGLTQGSESRIQSLLLALWESEVKILQLNKEINKQKEETSKCKNELEKKMEEKVQVMRDCLLNSHHRHPRHRHGPHHLLPPSIPGAHPLSMASDSTAIIRSDLLDIKEVILDAINDMKDSGRSDHQDIKELIIDGIMESRYIGIEDTKKESEMQKQSEPHRQDCYDHFESGGRRESGVYTIYPFKGDAEAQGIRVWCDMGERGVDEGIGGGWTVILQRRHLPQPVLFNRTYQDYAVGFGDPDTEYWIGNEVLHLMTTLGKPQSLRIDMEDFDGVHKFASYGRFSVGSSRDNFRLTVGMFSSRSTVKSDSLAHHNSAQFSTFDRDNDNSDTWNCATTFGGSGGFWNNACNRASPSAPIRGKDINEHEMHFEGFNDDFTTLKELTMKIRPSG